jgi:hypothetical protein
LQFDDGVELGDDVTFVSVTVASTVAVLVANIVVVVVASIVSVVRAGTARNVVGVVIVAVTAAVVLSEAELRDAASANFVASPTIAPIMIILVMIMIIPNLRR